MTNYNERLDEILRSISTPDDWISDEAYTLSIGKAKQAIISLIKEEAERHADGVIGATGSRLSKFGNLLCDELIAEQRQRNNYQMEGEGDD